MPITDNQAKITQEFRSRMRDAIKEYENAPEDISGPLDELWVAFKETAGFDDDNQADLAAFGAIAQFIALSSELEDKDLRGFLSLYATSLLVKIRKGDRLD